MAILLNLVKLNSLQGNRDLSCEERLKECGLTTLETSRLRGIKQKFYN